MTNLPTSLPPHVARPHPWLVKNNKRTSQVSRIHGKDRVLVLAGGVSSSLSRTRSDVVSALPSVSWASTNSIHLLRRLSRKESAQTGALTPFLSSHRPLSSQSCISCTRGAIGCFPISLALFPHTFEQALLLASFVRTRSLRFPPALPCLRLSTKVYPSSWTVL